MFAMLALAKAGYGSLLEIQQLDTVDLLDAIEFERMSAAIEAHKMKGD